MCSAWDAPHHGASKCRTLDSIVLGSGKNGAWWWTLECYSFATKLVSGVFRVMRRLPYACYAQAS